MKEIIKLIYENLVKNKINDEKKYLGLPICGSVLLSSFFNNNIIVVSSFEELEMAEKIYSVIGKKCGIIKDYILPYYSNTKSIQENQFVKNINKFISKEVDVLIVKDSALLQKMPSFDEYAKNIFTIKVSDNLQANALTQRLLNLGFDFDEQLEKPSSFRKRGDRVEILVDENAICKVEYFDDEIESIKIYDKESLNVISSPNEFTFYPQRLQFTNKNADEILNKCLNQINITKVVSKGVLKLDSIIEELNIKISTNNFNIFNPYLNPFFDYENNLLTFFKNEKITTTNFELSKQNILKEINNYNLEIDNLIIAGELLESHKNYFENADKIFANLKNSDLFSTNMLDDFDFNLFEVKNYNPPKYINSFFGIEREIQSFLNSGKKVIIFCGNENNKNILIKYLKSQNIFTADSPADANLLLSDLYFPASFISNISDIKIYGTEDLFRITKNIKTSKIRQTFYLPQVGEYVVHEKHGIGKCVGLEKLKLGTYPKDYFIVEYKNNDRLYVPSDQVELLSAYVGKAPTLNKIGGVEFAKIKEQVYKKAKDLAFDLVALYKARHNKKSFAYSPDDENQIAFENSFEFEETEDQILALNAIKSDLESGKVMDRLLCGDVGYGKTEVALRAAYKVINDNKQVVFLCPTTILSEQHYRTAKKRFENFGVNVECLNRFKTPKQKKEILQNLENGKIDLLIATHAILGGNAKYKDLGLLILDEEQRFGVAHKEKIKRLKNDISVLSMSATPIPRTLHMSLAGIRDISILSTPPQNRISPKTVVTTFSVPLLHSAISNELARGGQVLVVLNDTAALNALSNKISQMFENARVGYAHGQMEENMLEQRISSLYNGEYDIFVSTTLIENGIDLPLANTIIILNADKMGLSQLYQLRGRIGRGTRSSVAYFTYEDASSLSSEALARLETIATNTGLGSGFKIAMKDLEIRGAGNVLGSEQSGQMAKVGYDLYVKLLSAATKEIENGTLQKEVEVKLDIDLPAFIDKAVMQDEGERIKEYVKLSSISTPNDAKNVIENFTNLYGENSAYNNLVYISYLKNLCKKHKILQIRLSKNNFFIKIDKNNLKDLENILKSLQHSSIAFALDTHSDFVQINILDRQKTCFYDMIKLITVLND